MAPIAFILGGICGTFSAAVSWLIFGLSLWGATQVYFFVGLSVAALMIAATLMRPRPVTKTSTAAQGMQRA